MPLHYNLPHQRTMACIAPRRLLDGSQTFCLLLRMHEHMPLAPSHSLPNEAQIRQHRRAADHAVISGMILKRWVAQQQCLRVSAAVVTPALMRSPAHPCATSPALTRQHPQNKGAPVMHAEFLTVFLMRTPFRCSRCQRSAHRMAGPVILDRNIFMPACFCASTRAAK